MIIKSESKTFFFWFSNLCIIGGIYGFIYMFFGGFSNESILGHFVLIVVLLILLWIYGKMLWDANAIIIDTEMKNIIFKNRYTKKQKLYQFDYFDGFVTHYQYTKFGNFKVIYFVKDQRLLYKVSKAVYSNQDQMLAALPPIKDMGLIEYSFIDSIRNLLGRKVLTK
jgi:hypothetical protein